MCVYINPMVVVKALEGILFRIKIRKFDEANKEVCALIERMMKEMDLIDSETEILSSRLF